MARDILFYNFHLPDDVRLFTTPRAAVKRWDSSVIVYDVRIGDGFLRNYAFTDRWFEVNCVFDLDGRLRPEAGPVDWAFNCDICTPSIVQTSGVYNVDLFLDILVAPDGKTFALVDENDFAEARIKGWLTSSEIAGARLGVDDLVGIIRDGGLRPFLERILPFDSVLDSAPQGPPRKFTIEDVPEFQFDERLRLWPDLGAHESS
jgi:predicted RNA-binding protein associated with RNAse of E/G family